MGFYKSVSPLTLWKPGVEYPAGERVFIDNRLMKVVSHKHAAWSINYCREYCALYEPICKKLPVPPIDWDREALCFSKYRKDNDSIHFELVENINIEEIG